MAQKTIQKESTKKIKAVVLPKQETPLIISKEVTVDENSIKLPSDFDSLHNIKDFGKTYKQVISFITNIKEYQQEYLDNQLKTVDEVLQIIPENQLKLYKIYLQDVELCTWEKLNLKHIQDNIVDNLRNHRAYYQKFQIELIGLISNRDKIFLIDTVNKKIQLCLWYRNNGRETIQGFLYGAFCNLRYNSFIFEILPDEDIFRVGVKLDRKCIIGPKEYEERRKQLQRYDDFPYGIGSNGGFEFYDFCMRTNKFKEYNEKESYRTWHYYSNRTFKY